MDSIREQMDLTNEISDAISNPVGMGNQVDEVRLSLLLSPSDKVALPKSAIIDQSRRTSSRQNSKRSNRPNWTIDSQVPSVHRFTPPLRPWALPPAASVSLHSLKCWEVGACIKLTIWLVGVAQKAEEDDEEAQLRQLQAELAM